MKIGTLYKHIPDSTGPNLSGWVYYIFMSDKNLTYFGERFMKAERSNRLSWDLVHEEEYEEYNPKKFEKRMIILNLFRVWKD